LTETRGKEKEKKLLSKSVRSPCNGTKKEDERVAKRRGKTVVPLNERSSAITKGLKGRNCFTSSVAGERKRRL